MYKSENVSKPEVTCISHFHFFTFLLSKHAAPANVRLRNNPCKALIAQPLAGKEPDHVARNCRKRCRTDSERPRAVPPFSNGI